MSPLLVLPTPLSSASISLGQLITDPLYADSASLKPFTRPAYKESAIQSKFEDTVTHDEYGRFTSTRFVSRLSGQAHYSHENLLLLNAEHMSHTTIDKPSAVFNNLRRHSTTRLFLREMARQKKPVYFVTGLQTLKNPRFKRAVVEHGLITESQTPTFRLPVRRVDSASSFTLPTLSSFAKSGTTSNINQASEAEESVLAVELLKVKCRVGANSEPHCISDLEYAWSYYALDEDEDLQLSIGLGRALKSCEMRALQGLESEEYEEGSWSSSYEESEDGIGGF
ncbi:hypothetical protein EJ02DRAFT_516334 [Clathrospora elynae]|uniref:Uncharacterized protein n=1 Tax=Clathrospora elynae TaxID=706981 RepID=A0A6A5S763_9PLEO|nr:hypothetical protein EJ02DRAFT_516334 [Clathrospora elynae]